MPWGHRAARRGPRSSEPVLQPERLQQAAHRWLPLRLERGVRRQAAPVRRVGQPAAEPLEPALPQPKLPLAKG